MSFLKIESLQNQAVKSLVRLKTKKNRDETGQFLVEGRHMIEEARDAGLLKEIYTLDFLPEFDAVKQICCSQAVLNKISAQKSDAKMIGLCSMPSTEKRVTGSKVLILERIQDPGNAGTLIRSALSFGIDQVILSSDCADPYGPKTLQASQGAVFHLPITVLNPSQAIESLKEQQIRVYGAALHHDSTELSDLTIPGQYAIVIGNEGQGISDSTLALCDELVHIEMKTFESLNAAIAGSILLYVFQFPKQQA